MPPQAIQVPFFYLVGLYVGWQLIRRNRRNGGMAEWRNGGMVGMAVRRKEWQNGQMAGMATYVLFMVHTDTDDDDDDDDDT